MPLKPWFVIIEPVWFWCQVFELWWCRLLKISPSPAFQEYWSWFQLVDNFGCWISCSWALNRWYF